VASQTPKNIYITDKFSDKPIMAPLLCHNKNEIIKCATKIGTFQDSICNNNDCCVMYLPQHPILEASEKYISYALKNMLDYKDKIKIKKVII